MGVIHLMRRVIMNCDARGYGPLTAPLVTNRKVPWR